MPEAQQSAPKKDVAFSRKSFAWSKGAGAAGAKEKQSEEKPAVRPGGFLEHKLGGQVKIADSGNLQHLNGQVATLEEYEELSCRWKVKTENGEVALLSRESLLVLDPKVKAGAWVRIHGLTGAPHYNGMTGVCEGYQSNLERWRVRLDSGETKNVKHENLEAVGEVKPVADEDPDKWTYPGDECSSVQVADDADFCKNLEKLLASGDLKWEDY